MFVENVFPFLRITTITLKPCNVIDAFITPRMTLSTEDVTV